MLKTHKKSLDFGFSFKISLKRLVESRLPLTKWHFRASRYDVSYIPLFSCGHGCSFTQWRMFRIQRSSHVFFLYASHRTRTFLIRAHWEVSLHCSYANDESFSDAVHGSYPVQQNIYQAHGKHSYFPCWHLMAVLKNTMKKRPHKLPCMPHTSSVMQKAVRQFYCTSASSQRSISDWWL